MATETIRYTRKLTPSEVGDVMIQNAESLKGFEEEAVDLGVDLEQTREGDGFKLSFPEDRPEFRERMQNILTDVLGKAGGVVS